MILFDIRNILWKDLSYRRGNCTSGPIGYRSGAKLSPYLHLDFKRKKIAHMILLQNFPLNLCAVLVANDICIFRLRPKLHIHLT